jgi:hypothetical protein
MVDRSPQLEPAWTASGTVEAADHPDLSATLAPPSGGTPKLADQSAPGVAGL